MTKPHLSRLGNVNKTKAIVTRRQDAAVDEELYGSDYDESHPRLMDYEVRCSKSPEALPSAEETGKVCLGPSDTPSGRTNKKLPP